MHCDIKYEHWYRVVAHCRIKQRQPLPWSRSVTDYTCVDESRGVAFVTRSLSPVVTTCMPLAVLHGAVTFKFDHDDGTFDACSDAPGNLWAGSEGALAPVSAFASEDHLWPFLRFLWGKNLSAKLG
eukprot:3932951-Rhodomonas_salina.4